ncbi:MAG: aminopeptidase [Spirochaetales bacterium]|jgi:leucyl aminopeptidase (aminopeptidase T)|nr:aminopeptidase [Spirochaetales bacterium]
MVQNAQSKDLLPGPEVKPRKARSAARSKSGAAGAKTAADTTEDLKAAARIAIRDSLGVQPGERVLIITNPVEEVSRISWALHDAALDARAEVVLMYQSVKTQFDFCSEEVIGALKSCPDVCISLSAQRLGKDRKAILTPYRDGGYTYDSTFHHLLHGIKTLRGFWSPRITLDSFIRAVPVDYTRMRLECLRVKEILDDAVSLHVTNKTGTDIFFSIAGRQSFTDDGNFSIAGRGGNLPAGETFVSPVVGSAEGRIVYDGSISSLRGEILIKTPITVHVSRGFVKKIEGKDEAEELLATILMGEENARVLEEEGKLSEGKGAVYARNARNIGELGIGLNPNAKMTGNMLEDEKVYHTCHFAIGSNYDEDAPALIHLDGLVSAPTVIATFPSGKTQEILRDGELVGLE